MTPNENDRPQKSAPKGGRGKSDRKRPRESFNPDFNWGEVDDVEQEDLILPSKTNKKRSRYRVEKIESTLTVQNPQANLYQKKSSKRSSAARSAVTDPDLALPSYGKLLDSAMDDDIEFFLRNAEEAEKKKQAKKERAAVKKSPAKTAPSPQGSAVRPKQEEMRSEKPTAPKKERRTAPQTPAKSTASVPVKGKSASSAQKVSDSAAQKTDDSDDLRAANKSGTTSDLLIEMRQRASERLGRFGFTESQTRRIVAHVHNIEDLADLFEQLLDGKLLPPTPGAKRPEEPQRPEPKRQEPKREERAEREPKREESKREEPKRPPRAERESKREEPKREEPKREKPERPERKRERPEPKSEQRSEPAAPKPIAVPKPIEGETRTFGTIPLSDLMLEMLHDASYLEPTQIQAGTIPRILAGVDLMGQSQTGSGKTAAFMIPIIEGIESCEPGDDPVALVVVPTRELAVQIRDETVKLSRNREIITVACYGGKPIVDQVKKIQNGVDIVIGTPGRLLDLAKRRAISFSRLRWVVLDEADRMLDIGFRPDIERILKMTPTDRQTLLFSATLADEVVRLAKRYMKEPETYDFSENKISSETIEQYYLTVDRERKFDALLRLLEQEKPTQAIVFCRTKRMVDKLGRGLSHDYRANVAAIHGDLTQSQRDHIMRAFRGGEVKILVATDVVGRGIDISGISHIINYDIPQFCDDYIHRVGRTGRMGREGVAFTLVTSQEGAELTRIEMRINRLLKRAELEGFEAFARPVDREEPGKEAESKETKAVFGKPTRRIRRAL